MSVPDGQIAAIARLHGLSIARRNTRDFEECSVDLLDPFDPEQLSQIVTAEDANAPTTPSFVL